MRRWLLPVVALVVVALGCLGLARLVSDVKLRPGGEVTSVADAGQTVLVDVQWRSSDGTISTRRWVVDDGGELHNPPALPAAASPQTRGCAGPICYRVGSDALRVEVSRDGGTTYDIAWQIDDEDYLYLEQAYPDLGDPARHLSSRSVVVHPVASGHVVFVANGRDGLLFRDVNGAWHRLGSPDSGEGCCYYNPPLPLPSEPRPTDPVAGYVIGGVVLAVLGSAGLALRGRRRYGGLAVVVPLAVLAGYGAYLGWNFPPVGMLPGWVLGIPLIIVSLGAGVWLAVWFVRRTAGQPAAIAARSGSGR